MLETTNNKEMGKNRPVVFLVALSIIVAAVAMFACPSPSIAAEPQILPEDTVGGMAVTDARIASPSIMAPRAIAVNDAGEILFARNADEECKIASVTKVMTSIVACEYDPTLSAEIRVSEIADATPGSSSNALAGDTLTLGEALEGIMLPSGNDMATAVAESIGRDMLVDEGAVPTTIADADGERRFVEAMNAKASELGMDHTLFVNACGLDDEQYEDNHHSTASDVAKMASYAMSFEPIRNVVCQSSSEMTVSRDGAPVDIHQDNTNRLLHDDRFNGVKTGFTDYAGSCLAASYTSSADMDGDGENDEIYVVVLGEDSSNDMYADVSAIADWETQARTTVDLSGGANGAEVGRCVHPEWQCRDFAVTSDGNARNVVMYSWEFANMSQRTEFQDIAGDIYAGDEVGAIVFEYDGEEVGRVPLVAMEGMEAPGFIDRIILFGKGIWYSITGQDMSDGHASHAALMPMVVNDDTKDDMPSD